MFFKEMPGVALQTQLHDCFKSYGDISGGRVDFTWWWSCIKEGMLPTCQPIFFLSLKIFLQFPVQQYKSTPGTECKPIILLLSLIAPRNCNQLLGNQVECLERKIVN